MRKLAVLLLVIAPACRFGGGDGAEPPPDAVVSETIDAPDSTVPSADAPSMPPPCTPGTDTDKDGADDCAENGDSDPFTDAAKFNGLHVTLGKRPEGWGNCDQMKTYADMLTRFEAPLQELDAYAGWSFDTGKDNVDDPEFGFQPAWPMKATGERFTLRYHGLINLPAGPHCFQIDIGSTDTGLGNNRCGQLYLGLGGTPEKAFAETGFGASSATSGTACLEIPAAGSYPFDIVVRYFNILIPNNKLAVRHCAGDKCTPTEGVPATMLQAQR